MDESILVVRYLIEDDDSGRHAFNFFFFLQTIRGTGEKPNFRAKPEKMLDAVDPSIIADPDSELPCYPRPNLKEAAPTLKSAFVRTLEEYQEASGHGPSDAKKSKKDE
jgi:hypothetical protein